MQENLQLLNNHFDEWSNRLNDTNKELVELIRSECINIMDGLDCIRDSSEAIDLCREIETLSMHVLYHPLYTGAMVHIIRSIQPLIDEEDFSEYKQLVKYIGGEVKSPQPVCDCGVLDKLTRTLYDGKFFDTDTFEDYVKQLKFNAFHTMTNIESDIVQPDNMVGSTGWVNIRDLIAYSVKRHGDDLVKVKGFTPESVLKDYRDVKLSIAKDLNEIEKDFFRIISHFFEQLYKISLTSGIDTVEDYCSIVTALLKKTKFNPIVGLFTLYLIKLINCRFDKKRLQEMNYNTVSRLVTIDKQRIIKNGLSLCDRYGCVTLEESCKTLLTLSMTDENLMEAMCSIRLNTNYCKEVTEAIIGVGTMESAMTLEALALEDITLSSLTEGFKILNNGDIEITTTKNTTLMEEYSSNHRLLKQNHKLGDIEAMKYNLVYLFILVDSLESQILYNPQASVDQKEEAKRVLRLCNADIGVYLPEVKRQDSRFDLNQFYNKVKRENNTIRINTVDTISGVKLILNTIL